MGTRFAMYFNHVPCLYSALGMAPSKSWIDVGETEVVVQMGIGFRATFPRASVTSATADTDRVYGWGAHGWRGKWLVNASSANIVRIEISPAAHARTMGFPVSLTTLRIGVKDPDGLIAALQAG